MVMILTNEEHEDEYKNLIEESGTYGVSGVLLGHLCVGGLGVEVV